jgi:hypothetical protein
MDLRDALRYIRIGITLWTDGMPIVTEQVASIEGQRLTTWAVLPGGERVSLGFASEGGDTHQIVLPIEALTGLLMTLPRMLQSALDERCPDGTLRVVHPLGDWRLERAAAGDALILMLGTRDGFDVAFAMHDEEAGALGVALLNPSPESTENLTRRPN